MAKQVSEKAANRGRAEPHEQSPERLNEVVYTSIKEWILDNRLRPGVKLTHQSLAEALSVSRTPVRESLERLYQEGYVVRVPRRGYFVAGIEIAEVHELYETREALEIHQLRQSLSRGIDKRWIRQLEIINSRYSEQMNGGNTRKRLSIDKEFHLTLASITKNDYLISTLGEIYDKLILKRRVDNFHDTTGVQPYSEHTEFLRALKSGDGAAAETILREHIRGACLRLLSYLNEIQDSPDPLLRKRNSAPIEIR